MIFWIKLWKYIWGGYLRRDRSVSKEFVCGGFLKKIGLVEEWGYVSMGEGEEEDRAGEKGTRIFYVRLK